MSRSCPRPDPDRVPAPGRRTSRADPATPAPEGDRRGPTSALLAGLALAVAGAVAALLLVAVHDALLPGPGLLGDAAPLVVPVYGAPLVVAGMAAAGLAWLLRRRLRRMATVVALAAAVGAMVLAIPVGVMVNAVWQAGGSVDLPDAVALATSAASPPDARPVYTTTADGQSLHLAVDHPRGSSGPAPVMVYVHGGGWIGGSELGRLADMRRLADDGWSVVSVEYTLARDGHPTWDVAGPEVACALTQVIAHAAEYGGDPSRVLLAGDSAGGQLVVSVGYHAASGTQPSSCGGSVPVPRAIVAEYPAVDLVDCYEHGASSSTPGPERRFLDARYLAVTYTGGTPDQVPERYRAVSGQAAITPAAPPTLVVDPTEDSLVPPAGVARFVAAARAAGVRAELVPVPYSNHAFDTFQDGSLGHQAGFSIIERWSHEQVAPR